MSWIESNYKKLEEELNLERKNNSDIKLVDFKKDNGECIEYSLYELYKVDGIHLLGVIKNSKDENSAGVLLDSASIKKLILFGYINNAIVTKSGNTIRHAKNKIKAYPEIKDYKDININSISDRKSLENIRKNYKCICLIDNTNIESVSWLRLEPKQIIFDLSGNICAFLMCDELGNEEYVSYKIFKKMINNKYNIGKFSPRSDASNYSRTLSYIRIDKDNFDAIKVGIKDAKLKYFKKFNESYIIYIDKIDLELAKLLFDSNNVLYAIPKPEKMLNKNFLESSLTNADYLWETRFSKSKYELVKVEGINANDYKTILIENFKELMYDGYLKNYDNIIEYIKDMINEKEIETRDLKDKIQVIDDVTLDNSNIKLEIRKDGSNRICLYIIINSKNIKDEIRIDKSEKSYTEYIRDGIDLDIIRKPLKRALLMNNESLDNLDRFIDCLD